VQIEQLEKALIDRANALAKEYLARGHTARDKIIEDANDRLRLREDREILVAKAAADRTYRRRVQASEIKLQAELDQLRWGLVQEVLGAIRAELDQLAQDRARYTPLLRELLARGAAAIEQDEVLAQVNSRDHELLRADWDSMTRDLVPGKRIALAAEVCPCVGGVLVRSADGNIRVDNTFEGRVELLASELQRVVMERLFASMTGTGALFHG
jgi:V/A-type H+-transporting ATPase subunit E